MVPERNHRIRAGSQRWSWPGSNTQHNSQMPLDAAGRVGLPSQRSSAKCAVIVQTAGQILHVIILRTNAHLGATGNLQ